MLDGEFRLKPISKPRGWPDVITVFLRSLTEHWAGQLIAVIVSGYHGDGAAGTLRDKRSWRYHHCPEARLGGAARYAGERDSLEGMSFFHCCLNEVSNTVRWYRASSIIALHDGYLADGISWSGDLFLAKYSWSGELRWIETRKLSCRLDFVVPTSDGFYTLLADSGTAAQFSRSFGSLLSAG